ncbi:MAG: pyridoxal phosphate-dependent aminotransferase [Granulosicoccaceae bacterium]|jgi:aspartate/methionine/tyrosine aminotransferase
MPEDVHIAARMLDIHPFHVMALLARARELEAQGRDIVHMEIGEPDFVTADPIVEAGRTALTQGRTHYTPAQGLPALREAICAFYAQRYGATVDPARVFITPGASGALQLVCSALINPGESVLMADPCYPCNRNFVRLVEGRSLSIPVDAATHYQLTAELIAQYWQDDSVAAMVASPANPTGMLVAAQQLQAMLEVVSDKGGRLIVDEIYHGLVYETEAASALQYSREAFVINSFSKYFGMTGWRIGWAVVPEAYCDAVNRLAQNLFLAASTPAQFAALAAFEPASIAILEQRRAEFARRRDYLLPVLRELGFDIPVTPEGAFYIYADCSRFTDDSFSFAHNMLEEAGVAITPGIDFGTHHANRYVRFSYTTSMSRLEEGARRLREYLK